MEPQHKSKLLTSLGNIRLLSSPLTKGYPVVQMSSDADILAVLCSKCQGIFEGEWAEKASLELLLDKNANTNFEGTIKKSIEETIDPPDLTSTDGSTQEAESTTDSAWYEEPDWVKLSISDNSSPDDVSFTSPQHHSIENLEVSALNGCQLCALLKEIVFARVDELDETLVASLVGIVVVRPSNEYSDYKNSVVLEISYFVDARVEQSAYEFGIEVLLLPYEGVVSSLSASTGANLRIPKETPTAECLEHIQKWLVKCGTDHVACPKQNSNGTGDSSWGILPSRLLRVKSTGDNYHISLRQTASLHSQTPYIALSHCWGRSPIIRLLLESYQQFLLEIAFEKLSKTFQDAVKFTIALGIDYVWIDSLCIIQDSPEDWRFEASLMCAVYSNAYVTLAATSSHDGAGGLFHPENKTRSQKYLVETKWKGHAPGLYICIDENAWDRQILHAPLNERGWVLQEQVLSPRTIHCANDQIWWSCSSTTPCCNETFPDGVPAQNAYMTSFDPLADMRFLTPGDLVAYNGSWITVVQSYTQRALTFGSDKLIALAGIADAASHIMGVPKESYLAGLWRCDLVVDLLWRVAATGLRSEVYRAPSWSWASIDGEIYFHSDEVRQKARNNACAKVVEVEVTPVQDVLGPVSAGFVVLEGPLVKMNLSSPNIEDPDNSYLNELRIHNITYKSDVGFVEALDHQGLYKEWPANGKDVYFACLMSTSELVGDKYTSEGMILERKHDLVGPFYRIGWLRVFHSSPFESTFEWDESDMLKEDEFLQYDRGHTYVYRIL